MNTLAHSIAALVKAHMAAIPPVTMQPYIDDLVLRHLARDGPALHPQIITPMIVLHDSTPEHLVFSLAWRHAPYEFTSHTVKVNASLIETHGLKVRVTGRDVNGCTGRIAEWFAKRLSQTVS